MASKNEVKLTFAGDTKQIEQSFDKVGAGSEKMASQVDASTSSFDGAEVSASGMSSSLDRAASGATFLIEGFSSVNESVSAFTDISRTGAIHADRMARSQLDIEQAALDVEQALLDTAQAAVDLEQAERDVAQSGIDVEQALLDQAVAQTEYNAAVAEFGAGSHEARQAEIDMAQAGEDLAQAQLDAEQATVDSTQALMDADQAAVDAAGSQLDLSEANRDGATSLGLWTETLSGFAPLLFTAIGAMQLLTSASIAQRGAQIAGAAASGIATAAQWAWNIALMANPIGLIILAVVALVAVIVLIATKTQWFQNIWNAIWSVIGDPVRAVWAWIKDTLWPGIQKVWNGIINGVKILWEGVKLYFGFWRGIIDKVLGWVGDIPDRIGRAFRGLGNAISAPFRAGFDAVKRFWNNTIGGKGFDIPSWVPFGFGGKSFRFPTFHQGGIVPGAPGSEMLAVLQAGERITPAGMVRAEDGSMVPRSFFDQPARRPARPPAIGWQDIQLPGVVGMERLFLSWLQDLLRRNNLQLSAR